MDVVVLAISCWHGNRWSTWESGPVVIGQGTGVVIHAYRAQGNEAREDLFHAVDGRCAVSGC
jgi:hypothetical protein